MSDITIPPIPPRPKGSLLKLLARLLLPFAPTIFIVSWIMFVIDPAKPAGPAVLTPAQLIAEMGKLAVALGNDPFGPATLTIFSGFVVLSVIPWMVNDLLNIYNAIKVKKLKSPLLNILAIRNYELWRDAAISLCIMEKRGDIKVTDLNEKELGYSINHERIGKPLPAFADMKDELAIIYMDEEGKELSEYNNSRLWRNLLSNGESKIWERTSFGYFIMLVVGIGAHFMIPDIPIYAGMGIPAENFIDYSGIALFMGMFSPMVVYMWIRDILTAISAYYAPERDRWEGYMHGTFTGGPPAMLFFAGELFPKGDGAFYASWFGALMVPSAILLIFVPAFAPNILRVKQLVDLQEHDLADSETTNLIIQIATCNPAQREWRGMPAKWQYICYQLWCHKPSGT